MLQNSPAVQDQVPEKQGMLRRLLQNPALRYLVIGGAAAALDAALFMALYNLAGFAEWQAHSVSFTVASFCSFVVNARHNFKTNDYIILRLFSFSVVCVIGFLIGYGVIEAAKSIGVDPNIGKIASLPLAAVIQYLLNSRITFRKTNPGRAA